VHSLRFRSLAQAILPRVTQPGGCVAITGSVARGTAGAASGLDSWIIGRRRGLTVRHLDGISVKLHCQQPAEATTFENLCAFEVDALVLVDGAGAFEQLQPLWRKQRGRGRRTIRRLHSTRKHAEARLTELVQHRRRARLCAVGQQVVHHVAEHREPITRGLVDAPHATQRKRLEQVRAQKTWPEFWLAC